MKWRMGNVTLDILPPVKRYMNAIEHRLRVDRKTRVRIMTELASDFQSRRESGQSDESIMQELGTPEEIAAEFNASLGTSGRTASRWRWAFVALAAAIAFTRLLLPGLLLPQSGNLGIIGGADGPTAIFVTTTASSTLWETLPWFLGCTGGFLMAGWCRRGAAQRYALPLLLGLAGILQQGVTGFLLQRMLGSLAGAYLLSSLTTHGVWLCLLVAVWAAWEWRRTANHDKKS